MQTATKLVAGGVGLFILLLSVAFCVVRRRRDSFAMTAHLPVTVVKDRAELGDLSAYFDGFSACDVAARAPFGGDTADGYLACLITDAPPAEIDALRRHVAAADAAARAHPWLRLHADVPWRVALLEDRAEGGWPHTHGGVVCMPIGLLRGQGRRGRGLDDDLVRVLVHERVHVLQRRNPAAARAYHGASDRLKMTPVASFPPGSDVARRRRSNPDLDGFLYSPSLMLFPDAATAARDGLRAARLAWIDLDTGREATARRGAALPAEEHPWEAMAYAIAAEAVP